jgi:aspartyl-tRNA(Asn)/glutamyl-tRNA(Gln) amidotransferase subunit A
MIDLNSLTLTGAADRMAKGEFSSSELVLACLGRIGKENADLNAFLEVFEDAEVEAKRTDEMRGATSGSELPLLGVPIALKDNIMLAGKYAGAGSKILKGYRAAYDSTVALRLRAAGAVMLGRTNMDEFAMGSSTENSAYGVVKNPLDRTRVPGGSSGGSAAAVAAGFVPAAFGSDTGGSIRQPAAFCGLVGLKPTYGAVSRYGLIALGSSLDQIGPLTKTVADAELLFRVIQGRDPLDATTLSYTVGSSTSPVSSKPTLGIPRHLIEREGIDADVLKNFEASVERLRSFGYTIKDIELPNVPYSLAVYYIVMPAEVSSNLARFDGIKYGFSKQGENLLDTYLETRGAGFGKEVRRRIVLGTYVLSSGYYDAFYGTATAVRTLIADDFKKAFTEVGAIITPTTPSPAFKIGEKSNDPLAMYLSDIFTVPANVSGIPALSVPSGTALRDGVQLPLGLQVMAPHEREDVLFAVGRDFIGETHHG